MSAKSELAGYNARLERVWVKLGAHRQPLTKLQVRLVVELFRDELLADARAGRGNWPGVGVLTIARRKARTISNPQTRERMRLPRSWTLKLRASKHQKGTGDGP